MRILGNPFLVHPYIWYTTMVPLKFQVSSYHSLVQTTSIYWWVSPKKYFHFFSQPVRTCLIILMYKLADPVHFVVRKKFKPKKRVCVMMLINSRQFESILVCICMYSNFLVSPKYFFKITVSLKSWTYWRWWFKLQYSYSIS